MRNHLYDVTNMAEMIRWDVICGLDNEEILSEENTFIKGVFEDPESILCRISYKGKIDCRVILDVLYTKEIDRLEVFIAIYKESSKTSDYDPFVLSMTSLIMQEFPNAYIVEKNDRRGYEVSNFWPSNLGLVYFKRLINIVSLTEQNLYELDDAQWKPTDVFESYSVSRIVRSLLGYGDSMEVGVPIPKELDNWVKEARK